MANDVEHPFICLWALCMSSLEKCLFKSFAHFFIGWFVYLEWSHVSSLCILEIKPLSEISLTNMFSHMVGTLFILMLFSLAMWKLFNLMKSHLFIVSFTSPALLMGQRIFWKKSWASVTWRRKLFRPVGVWIWESFDYPNEFILLIYFFKVHN